MFLKKIALPLVFAFSSIVMTQTFAASPAASTMHYGKTTTIAATTKGPASIVITNCSDEMANVSANFVDGSSKTMSIYPAPSYPMNVISIDNSYPFVTINIAAFDGAPLFPAQPVYPGQHVNIGCMASAATQSKSHPIVKVTK